MRFLFATLLLSSIPLSGQDRKLVAFPAYNPGECLAAFFKEDGTQDYKIIKVDEVSNAAAAKKGQTSCDNGLKKSFGHENGVCYVFCNPTTSQTQSE